MRNELKSLIRAVLVPLYRPIWRRIWMRIETRIAPLESRFVPVEQRTAGLESRITPVEQRVASLEAKVDAWQQHIPSLLNAVSSVGAFGHKLGQAYKEIARRADETERVCAHRIDETAHRIDETAHRIDETARRIDETERARACQGEEMGRIWERVEFIRSEILYEMKYGRSDAKPTDGIPEPRILAPETLSAAIAAGDLRVNLGCGHVPREGYLNVDSRDVPHVDIVADVRRLPFEPHSVREISSAHLLEHFPQELLRRQLLGYWHSLIQPGGRFHAVVPDGEAMLAGVADGSYSFADFREVLFGSQDYDGDFHFNVFTPESLGALLREAGFKAVEIVTRARRNGRCFEFEITATA